MEIASHHQRHRAAQWRVSSRSEDARLVADCPSRRALTVRSNYQWSDPYATDRRLARPQASFSVKSRLRGDSQALVDLRSFVISQLWKKFFRHGYRRNQFPPQLGSRPEVTAMRTARTIEQGLGRSVRGEKDYCAIILTGADLIRRIRPR